MQVILLERIEKLGQIGDTVSVKDGFARNFLLPRKKALRSTEANQKLFEGQRADLEARNLERKKEAEQVAEKLGGSIFVLIRSASDMGQLYGSVSSRDIVEVADTDGFKIDRSQVVLDKPLKSLGMHEQKISLHPEVTVVVQVNIARSEEEAEAQARGENVLNVKDEIDEEDKLQTTEFFEDDAELGEDGEVADAQTGEEE